MYVPSDGNDVIEVAATLFKNLVFHFTLRVSHSIYEFSDFRIQIACVFLRISINGMKPVWETSPGMKVLRVAFPGVFLRIVAGCVFDFFIYRKLDC